VQIVSEHSSSRMSARFLSVLFFPIFEDIFGVDIDEFLTIDLLSLDGPSVLSDNNCDEVVPVVEVAVSVVVAVVVFAESKSAVLIESNATDELSRSKRFKEAFRIDRLNVADKRRILSLNLARGSSD